MAFTVSGKTAIVTGAGSGINFAFTKLLLTQNCNVVLADLSLRPEVSEFIAPFTSETSTPRALFVKTDVASWKDLNNMISTTLSTFGDFHILCPGAGVYEPHWSSFWHPPGQSPESRDDPEGDRYALLDINVTHPIRATQLAMTHWLHPRESSGGKKPEPVSADKNPKRIIHISSVAAQLPVFRAPLYGASKHAISGFVRCLTPMDAEYGIKVNAVAPGVVKTPLWTDHPEKLVNVDQGKDAWVTQEEVAEAMMRCLVSEEIEAGDVIEVGASGRTRKVTARMDEGPDMSPEAGLATSNAKEGDDMVWGWVKDEGVWGERKGIIVRAWRIPGYDDPHADLLDLVTRWLRDEDNGRWLMIIDNVEDWNLLSGPTDEEAMAEYIPFCDHGKVLIATQGPSTPLSFWTRSSEDYTLRICPTENEISGLVNSQIEGTGMTADDDQIRKLAKFMRRNPLGLIQAGAFIRYSHCGIDGCVALLEGRGDAAMNVLNHRFDPHGRYPGTPCTMVELLLHTYQELTAREHHASVCWNILAHYGPTEVPAELLSSAAADWPDMPQTYTQWYSR